jgi:hypothetical protein
MGHIDGWIAMGGTGHAEVWLHRNTLNMMATAKGIWVQVTFCAWQKRTQLQTNTVGMSTV